MQWIKVTDETKIASGFHFVKIGNLEDKACWTRQRIMQFLVEMPKGSSLYYLDESESPQPIEGDVKEAIELHPVSVIPKKHGLYWVILKAHPINYMQVLTQKQYGEDSEGGIGWLSEDDDGRVTNWFDLEKFSQPSTLPIPSDIVKQLEDADPYVGFIKQPDGTTLRKGSFDVCISKLRKLISNQPQTTSVQILIDGLKQIEQMSDPGSHVYAIQNMKSIATNALQSFNTSKEEKK